MPLCKCSLCSLSFSLLNSSKAVQEQIFCFVNYAHSLASDFPSVFSDCDGKRKKRGWFHEFQICCNCWSVIFKYVTDICHFQHTPISGQCQVSARWLECGIDMSIINSYVIQLALQRRKTSSVWTWTSQVRSLSNLCLRLLRFGNFP